MTLWNALSPVNSINQFAMGFRVGCCSIRSLFIPKQLPLRLPLTHLVKFCPKEATVAALQITVSKFLVWFSPTT